MPAPSYSTMTINNKDRWYIVQFLKGNNDTVSLGDTVNSLHTPAPTHGGGGTPDQLQLKVPRSAQIFIFGGEGGHSRTTPTQSDTICPNTLIPASSPIPDLTLDLGPALPLEDINLLDYLNDNNII